MALSCIDSDVLVIVLAAESIPPTMNVSGFAPFTCTTRYFVAILLSSRKKGPEQSTTGRMHPVIGAFSVLAGSDDGHQRAIGLNDRAIPFVE